MIQPNKNTLLIIAALALPVVLLAIVMYSGSPKNNRPAKTANAINTQHPTLEQVRENVKNRLAQLEKMTPEQWPQERRIHPHAPPTLQQALTNNKNRLAQLEAMTPEQWEAQFKPKPVAAAPQPQPKSALDIIPKPETGAPKPVLPPTSGQ